METAHVVAPAIAPSRRIVGEVLRRKHDLVMIPAEGRGDVRESMFTSTAVQLMRDCPCAVWVIRRHRPERPRRLMAAVDPDPVDRRRDELNDGVMDLASCLARLEESELHIVHSWAVHGASILSSPLAGLPQDEMSRYRRETREAHRRRLNALLRRYPLVDLRYHVHLVEGDARQVIPEISDAVGVESIVMGTACREGIARWTIGNTAEVVLRRAGCSVLTVKPAGFVSKLGLAG